jgi:hypothetical protein
MAVNVHINPRDWPRKKDVGMQQGADEGERELRHGGVRVQVVDSVSGELSYEDFARGVSWEINPNNGDLKIFSRPFEPMYSVENPGELVLKYEIGYFKEHMWRYVRVIDVDGVVTSTVHNAGTAVMNGESSSPGPALLDETQMLSDAFDIILDAQMNWALANKQWREAVWLWLDQCRQYMSQNSGSTR